MAIRTGSLPWRLHVTTQQNSKAAGYLSSNAAGYLSLLLPLHAGVPSQRVHVQDPAKASDALAMESFDSRHSDHSLSAGVMAAMGMTRPPLRADSQVKYGLLARGDGSLFLRFAHAGYR